MKCEKKAYLKKEFRKNLRAMHTKLSFWVVAIVSGAAYYWLQLPIEEQAKLVAEYPFLVKHSPLISMFAWIYARAKPQTPPPEPPEDHTQL